MSRRAKMIVIVVSPSVAGLSAPAMTISMTVSAAKTARRDNAGLLQLYVFYDRTDITQLLHRYPSSHVSARLLTNVPKISHFLFFCKQL